MFKLPEIWKEAGRRGFTAQDSARGQSLTDADINLDNEELDSNDPDLPEFIRERLKERQHTTQIAAEVDRHRQQTAFAKLQQEKEDHHLREWLASQEYRRQYQALCDDINDAKTATREAYEHARKHQHDAEQALEEARRHALVVAGNRVYFTRDGKRLYNEDGTKITDGNTIAAARLQQAEHPEATTFEEHKQKEKARQQAASEVDQLRTVIGKLDDLDDRIKKGNLSREELALAQKEKQALIDDLPEEARERYERVHAARQNPDNAVATRTADPASFDSFSLDSHFEKAGARVLAPIEPLEQVSTQPGRLPASRTVDFSS